ncbi:MAG TPA: fused MFS/spermidine synthase [Candidatus Eisenbacteria bacterium]|nr:fused MFS/spermidine synthase [Candidatus Eisenbacteria bacterium]
MSSPPTQYSDRPPAIWGVVIAVFALCIFASAFLLFLVEPMVAKMVLPVVGGTPAVWTTSVLFFQTVLLVGYGYSHWLAIRLQWRWQALLHGVVLLLPITVLPIHLIPGWNPPTSGSPVGYLVVLLSAMVGLPFFVVSTTSPLVQHWFSRTGHPHSADPYFLYRASNLGSALGLLSYPALIEPHLGLRGQAQVWVGGYVAFLVLVGVCLGLVAWTRSRAGEMAAVRPIAGASDGDSVEDKPITWTRRLRWVLLAAVPSTWMLAVTSYFTTAIRPLPLLWVIPLALYLFSFAIVFARRPLIPRRLLNRIFPFYALPVLGLILLGGGGPFWALALIHFGAFFLAALLCHGELAADRPNARRLTEFYWWLAVGGATGGLLTAVVAPVVFNDFFEYPIAIIGAALLRPALIRSDDRRSHLFDIALPAGLAAFLLLGVGLLSASGVLATLDRMVVTSAATGADLVRVLIVFAIPAAVSAAFSWRPVRFGLTATSMLLLSLLPIGSQPAIFQQRDFFGVHKVVTDPGATRHELIDGGVIHGIQLTDPRVRDVPASYYFGSGPVGDFFNAEQPVDASWNVGVIGLGAGAMACYAQPQQKWTYYEIDPVVIGIAQNPALFTFLRDCTPSALIVPGDARLTIAKAADHSYDLIVIDAFGGDAIPVHLLTREAVQLYMSKLRPGGVLLFNVSNKYIDVSSVLAGEAAALTLVSFLRTDVVVTPAEAAAGKFVSAWVVMAANGANLGDIPERPGWGALRADPQFPVWTDDFSDVLAVTRLG